MESAKNPFQEGYNAFWDALSDEDGPGSANYRNPYEDTENGRKWLAGWGSAEDRWMEE